jgi:hypothetical protein
LNCPVQGQGACILRKLILLCYENGLKPIIPLHDALYIESDIANWESDLATLKKLMIEAAGFYFNGKEKQWAESIRVSAEVWGPEISPNMVWNEDKQRDFNVPITVNGVSVLKQTLHVDERAEEDYNQFKKYFEKLPKEEIESYEKKITELSRSYKESKTRRVRSKDGKQLLLLPIE